jgi:(1->4)-alpha-D-glucan 1-alpha-D-glucosylmutase
MRNLRIPVATYRFQFNGQFRFEDAGRLVPYLYRLGISDLYASPILRARKGSSHGYDVTDPTHLNPELGEAADFDSLVGNLKDHGMGLLLDIVPNHMAASPENPWWRDILENGTYSPHAGLFDIDWGSANNRVVLPVLGSPYDETLKAHELVVKLEDNGLFIYYHDLRLPLDIKSYGLILGQCFSGTNDGDGGPSGIQQLRHLQDTLEQLPAITSSDRRTANKRYRERQAAKQEFLDLVNDSPEVKTFLLERIAALSSKVIHTILEQQAYLLVFWRTGQQEINYRRFFDINDLVGVRVEDLQVFQQTHALVLKLIREGRVSGLRVDHIDGLKDPLQYLSRLQQAVTPETKVAGKSPRCYVVVEKILNRDEALPPEWPVFSTTGYDFANVVNTLFIYHRGVAALAKKYTESTGTASSFRDIAYRKKKMVMQELFPSEVSMLGRKLVYLAQQVLTDGKILPADLTRALVEVTACLPVYRTYLRDLMISPRDKGYLDSAVAEAKRRTNKGDENLAIDCLWRVLAPDSPQHFTPKQRRAWLDFILKWQQLTGAVMAKGFEDTALYSFNRLVSLNEVGGDPGLAGLSIEEFHRFNQERREHWPHTMNATSTHDTKRSEDVRARINVLSELSDEWERHLGRWQQWNKLKRPRIKGLPVPAPNTEIMIYETMLGAWPLYSNLIPEFKQRIKDYCIKAVREGKESSNWLSPDLEYESALGEFLDTILNNSAENKFLADFLPFCQKVAYYGALNSLAQVLLKITSTGIPDFYQGMELWDFSLVDPDNRRPVDFRKRERFLDDLIQEENQGTRALVYQLLNSWQDGRLKLYITYKALNIRRIYREVFRDGQYFPLEITGRKQEHAIAFSRHREGTWILVVVGRFLTKLTEPEGFPLDETVWQGNRILLAKGMPEKWLNIFTGESLQAALQEQGLSLSEVLNTLPVALLVGNVGVMQIDEYRQME